MEAFEEDPGAAAAEVDGLGPGDHGARPGAPPHGAPRPVDGPAHGHREAPPPARVGRVEGHHSLRE